MQKPAPVNRKPMITEVTPKAAISGGEVTIRGSGFTENGRSTPLVRFGELQASLLMSSPGRLVVRVPEGVVSGKLTVDSGKAVSDPAAFTVGIHLAENLHPVANPAADAHGNIFTTLSGSRGHKTPVSVYKVTPDHHVVTFLTDLMNPTGLAFDHEGLLYISSRMDGAIYQVTTGGRRTVYAEGMGIATGIAFDAAGDLYVGDRSGTIFKINRDRQIFVFATIEPSVSAYHLAFGPDESLYVTGPTTSSFDQVYRVSPRGEVTSFYRGLGRPQGLAFDTKGNLYVAASLAGLRGVVRLTPDAVPELAVSGQGIVGLAFTGRRTLVLASNTSLYELPFGVEGLKLPVGSQ
ncbi:MAG: IPT/TIG domain-containing protein [Acidobacteriota bacterium]|nr:IPT/TIG domain-containing protein [Acidobacteriota bacterium]